MRNYRQGASNPLPGFYRARVEDNLDPLNIGRVRVRIPQCHGIPSNTLNDTSIKSKDLPWAFPCMPFGSGYDHGSFVVPEVGDIVWVSFESGDPNQPIYFGASYGTASQEISEYGNFLSNYKGNTFVNSNGKWNSKVDTVTTPKEVTSPSVKVIYKSPKGTTIMLNDADEDESLTIIDRLGQMIDFRCPVSKENNSNNDSARGDKTTEDYDARKKLHGSARVMIKDASKQYIKFETHKDKSVTELSSGTNTRAKLTLTTTDKSAKVDLSVGSDKVSMDGSKIDISTERLNLNTDIYINGVIIADYVKSLVNELMATKF